MSLIVTNFATTTLDTALLNPVDTSLVVALNTGNLFATLSPGDWTYIVMVDSLTSPTKREVMKVTARSGDSFTVQRGMDNTIAQTWVEGDYVICRWVAAMVVDILSLMTGVQSVTGLNTDNTDPVNPIVRISVDGVTIQGAGTPGSPLEAVGSTGLGTYLDLGTGTSFNVDWDAASWFRINPTGNFTVSFSNTPAALKEKSIILEVVSAEGYNLTLPAGGTWGALGEPEFSPNTDLLTVAMRNADTDSFWMLAFPGTL